MIVGGRVVLFFLGCGGIKHGDAQLMRAKVKHFPRGSTKKELRSTLAWKSSISFPHLMVFMIRCQDDNWITETQSLGDGVESCRQVSGIWSLEHLNQQLVVALKGPLLHKHCGCIIQAVSIILPSFVRHFVSRCIKYISFRVTVNLFIWNAWKLTHEQYLSHANFTIQVAESPIT